MVKMLREANYEPTCSLLLSLCYYLLFLQYYSILIFISCFVTRFDTKSVINTALDFAVIVDGRFSSLFWLLES
jgi:hypothetical protein